MKNEDYTIIEEKNVIDDHLLDLYGNAFKFDHEKGIAEWLKNAVDAYIRAGIPDREQLIILRFKDGNQGNASCECIDFNGMTALDINKALKRWGDPNAAKRGLKLTVYGGHGNGGKFYMRQMFKESCFITYKNGVLNIFGFNEDRKYGFAKGYKDKKIQPQAALEIAGIRSDEISGVLRSKVLKGEAGFTVARGVAPTGMKNKIKIRNICEKLRKHPQAVRILDRTTVMIVHNNEVIFSALKPEKIEPLQGFESPVVIEMPEKLIGENGAIVFAGGKYARGRMILRTSETALRARFSDLNRIDILGEIGVIASYQIRELGLFYPQIDFIYGECECPILEDPSNYCVQNDRTKLIDNEKTRALRAWIANQVNLLCEKIAKAEEREKKSIEKKTSSDFNKILDQWKNKFMSKIVGDVLVKAAEEVGPENSFLVDNSFKEGDKGSSKREGGISKPPRGCSEKGSKLQRVLLSEHDEDPLNPPNLLILSPGQGVVYQRVQDEKEGIYWINTSSPIANKIIKKCGTESVRWRDYLFQRYVDIFIKEALQKLEKKEPERFKADTIDGEILGRLVSRTHDVASKELEQFLFDEHYSIDDAKP